MTMQATELAPKKINRTPKAEIWRPIFLQTLSESGNVLASCRAAHITRTVAYDARKKSREFAAEWATAMDEACDRLELVAWNRAQTISDTLLIFLLKAHRPERYSDHITRGLSIAEDANIGTVNIQVVYEGQPNA